MYGIGITTTNAAAIQNHTTQSAKVNLDKTLAVCILPVSNMIYALWCEVLRGSAFYSSWGVITSLV
jgi:hypothetical protein